MNRGTIGVSSSPQTVIRQRRDCDLNPGPSAPESSTLTTRLPSHPVLTLAYIIIAHTHIYIHTRPFNSPLSGTTRVSRYQKGKPIWILLKQETVTGSVISWAICKSAPRSRQITMPAPHHTGRLPFLPPNQQRQSTEGKLPYYY